MNRIILTFDGYWAEANKNDIPKKSGIYCVYACRYYCGEWYLDRLLYIGESINVNARLQHHEKLSKWHSALKSGEEIRYSFAPVNSDDRERAEAALIYQHKPPKNEQSTSGFDYSETEIQILGETGLLVSRFVVP